MPPVMPPIAERSIDLVRLRIDPGDRGLQVAPDPYAARSRSRSPSARRGSRRLLKVRSALPSTGSKLLHPVVRLARHPDAAVVGRDGRRRLDLDPTGHLVRFRVDPHDGVSRARSRPRCPQRRPLPTARNRGAALAISLVVDRDLDRDRRPGPAGRTGARGRDRRRRARSSRTRRRSPSRCPPGTRSRRTRRSGSTITTCVPLWLPKPFVIQTAPSPAAIPVGMPSVDFAGVTSPVSGSIRFTVESPWLITQTSPSSPIAMPVGSSPTRIASSNAFVLASIRTTEFADGTASPAPPPCVRRKTPAAATSATAATTAAINVLRRRALPLRPPTGQAHALSCCGLEPEGRSEPGRHITRGRRALGRVLRHREGQDVVDLGRQVGTLLRQRRRRGLDVRPQHAHLDVARVGSMPGQALEEQTPERVHIGALVDGIALDLFRRDVVDRSDELARLREPAHRHGPLRQAEVRHVGVVVGREQDVRRLHVAMDEPSRVGGIEGARDLVDDRRRAQGLEPARDRGSPA